MIGKLTGTFGGTTPDGAAVVEVGGVGYAVHVPLATLTTMRGGSGASTTLFVHTAVREDAIDLYGFPTEEELAFFRELVSVSSIGPKTALGILNIADVQTLKRSIAHGDATMLTKVYGIGKKSAGRIVVELRDKLAEQAQTRGETVGMGEDVEVVEALMALGYGAHESRQALKAVKHDITGLSDDKAGLRERLAAALKHLGSPSSR